MLWYKLQSLHTWKIAGEKKRNAELYTLLKCDSEILFFHLACLHQKEQFLVLGFYSHCRKIYPYMQLFEVHTLSTVSQGLQIILSVFYKVIFPFKSNCILKGIITLWMLCLVAVKIPISCSRSHTFVRPSWTLLTFMFLSQAPICISVYHLISLSSLYLHIFLSATTQTEAIWDVKWLHPAPLFTFQSHLLLPITYEFSPIFQSPPHLFSRCFQILPTPFARKTKNYY